MRKSQKIIKTTALSLAAFLIYSIIGIDHVHTHELAVYIHTHTPIASGSDAHSRDHEENDILVLDDNIAVNVTSSLKYSSSKSSKGFDFDPDNVDIARINVAILNPDKPPGSKIDAGIHILRDLYFLYSGPRRAPPLTR